MRCRRTFDLPRTGRWPLAQNKANAQCGGIPQGRVSVPKTRLRSLSWEFIILRTLPSSGRQDRVSWLFDCYI
jgi:hypothetical protein